MTTFPNEIDSDISVPPIYDNIIDLGAEAIQAIRSALFAVEENIGINSQGGMGSLGERVNVSIDEMGNIRPASLIGIGLVSLPITNSQISPTAEIDESKLNLTYTTQFLYNLFANLDAEVDNLNNFLSISGIKLEPHIAGSAYRHKLSHIDVDAGTLSKVNITTGTTTSRNTINSYTLTSEISNDLLSHIRADKANDTTTPPAHQAHNASGIYINSSNFASVPSTANDLQSFADYVDASSLALLGSRTQNLYSNGIPRTARNITLPNSKSGESLVDPTPATTYLLYAAAISPVDNIDNGDDVILLNPSAGVISSGLIDAQFSQVAPGDYITINYGNGSVPVTFTVDSTRKLINGSNRSYLVRINGKNLFASTNATIRIDRPFYHDIKFSSLNLAAAHNAFAEIPSLTVSAPSGAAVLGVNFDPDKLNSNHYNLYLVLYPTGNPAQKTVLMPAIDVTGDTGLSNGKYTLQSVVENINNVCRQSGYNLRFNAFSYQGQVGISLADRFNNASFSVISGATDGYGNYTASSNNDYPNNVVDNFNNIDALGFGTANANVASPQYAANYTTSTSALQSPTIVFAPLKKNFFYVDGVEKEGLATDIFTTKDGYGDGYWLAAINNKQVLANRVEVTYRINLDLSTSGLRKGKTIVVQPTVAISSSGYTSADYGRFTINNISFNTIGGTTDITVYDAIHGTGISPFLSSSIGTTVALYFSNDTVSFNTENVGDPNSNTSFKRFFEVYVNSEGKSFTHERARFNTSGSNITVDSINNFVLYSSSEMANINIVNVSPKLRGFAFGSYKKINLFFNSYNDTTGALDGYLCKFESPSTYSKIGPTVSGKKGENIRFYDNTNVDYIDINIPINTVLSSFTNKSIDIQLFPTLQLNQEKIFIGVCQFNDSTKQISFINDKRQFGNVSEKQLSTSAINFINAPQRLLDENGVIRGFDLSSSSTLTNSTAFSIKGGAALVEGKILDFNDSVLYVPAVKEGLAPSFSTVVSTMRWYLCVNSQGDFEFVASTDFDPSSVGTYGSLDHNRLFYANNPLNSSNYAVRGTYLAKLLSEFRDLLPLYVIEGTVGFASGVWTITSGTITDIRRFIERGNRGLAKPFTLGQTSSFRSLAAIKGYINELTKYISYTNDNKNLFGTSVFVRDAIDVSGFTFDFGAITKFYGEGGKFTVSSAASITKNTEFRNLPITVSSGIGFNVNGDSIVFDGCDITYDYDATADGQFTSANLSNVLKACILSSSGGSTPNSRKKLLFNNNRFISATSARFAFISLLLTGEDHYYEDVEIVNNRIETNASGDDKRAVIIVSCTSTATPTLPLGPRLIDCQITGNICNKNQLILVSGETNGSSKIANMPATANFYINRNVCGAICFLTRQDRTYSIANTTGINDKNNMIMISGNVCKYIYNGTNKGFINVIGSSNRVVNDIISGSNVYYGSAFIEKNTCSWIHVGVKNPTSYGFETPMLEIFGNKMNAFNSTFLNDYHSSFAAVNTALILDNVTGT